MDIINIHQGTLATLHRQLFIVELDGVIVLVGIVTVGIIIGILTITGLPITRCTFIRKTTAAAVAAVATNRTLPMQVLVAAMVAFEDMATLVEHILP